MRLAAASTNPAVAMLATLACCAALPACRREARARDPESVPAIPATVETDEPPKQGPPPAVRTALPCVADPPRVLAATHVLAPVGAVDTNGAWIAWTDAVTSMLTVQPPTGDALHAPLGAGDLEAPALAIVGDDVLAAVAMQRGEARMHRVFRIHAGAISELFTTPQAADDALDVVLAPTSAGVIVAWSDAVTSESSVVQSQFVPNAVVHGGTASAPVVRALTPPEHDASDPVFAARPDGSVIMAWLASHQVDDVIANATTADVFVRRIAANGEPVGAPVQISPGPGNRFGVKLATAGDDLWVSYRVAGDADVESGGDGGMVALMRLGPDLHPSTSPVYVSDRDANPSGASFLALDAHGGVSVFWAERSADHLVSLRRPVGPDGRPLRAANIEPLFQGEIPFAGDAARPWIVTRGEHGEPAVLHARCPDANTN